MNNLNKERIQIYLEKLHKSGESRAVVTRKLASLKKFLEWNKDKGYIGEKDYLKMVKALESPIDTLISNIKYKISKLQIKNQKEKLDTSHQSPVSSFGLQHYIGLIIILIFMAAMGAGIYSRFFLKSQSSLAYSTAPNIRAGRLLSFQGRLTDTPGNPIITATNVAFKLYNVASGGSPLYTTGTCSITPDSDGIINALIGGVGYTPTPPTSAYNTVCGTEIPSSIFSENADVYLGVTVVTDEMTPRQQIANVGYAINSETLQGLPPGTNVSTIPYINAGGDLLIAASSPGIRSTYASSNFTISSAQATTIQSAGAGDVILQATESGSLKIRTGGTTDTNTRLTVDNGGNVGIGTTAPTTKLEVNGQVKITGGTPGANKVLTDSDGTGLATWTDVSSTAGPWTLSAPNLYPDSTSSNVGIGTTAPTEKLDVNGNVKSTGAIIGSLTGMIKGTTGTLSAVTGTTNYATYWSDNNTIAAEQYLNVSRGGSGAGTFTKGILVSPGTTTAFTTVAGTDNYIPKWSSSYPTTTSTLYDNGNVGVGTTAPTSLLDVNSKFNVLSGGNVGIGITTPGYQLDVQGTNGYVNAKTGLCINGICQTSWTGVTSYWTAYDNNIANNNTGNVGIGTTAPLSKLGVVGNLSVGATYGAAAAPTSGAVIEGNVGIGISAPTAKLQVYGGPVNVGPSNVFDARTGGLRLYSPDSTKYAIYFTGGHTDNSAVAPDGSVDAQSVFGDAYATVFNNSPWNWIWAAGSTNRMELDGGTGALYVSGNVGIGMTAPTEKLNVNGNVKSTGAIIGSLTGMIKGTTGTLSAVTGTTNYATYWNDNNTIAAEQYLNVSRGGSGAGTFTKGILVSPGTTTAFTTVAGTDNYILKWSSSYPTTTSTLYDNGNVGIGTTVPVSKLGIVGNLSVGATYGIVAAPTSGAVIEGNVGVGTSAPAANFDVNGTAWLRGTGTGGLFVDALGNVGIGNTSPTQKLDITGNLRFSGALMPNNTAGVSGQFLISGGAGASPTWTSTVPATSLKWNALTNPDGALSLTMGTNATTFTWTSGNIFAFDSTGNVGIGTSTPTAGNKLDVVGAARVSNGLTVAASGVTVTGNSTITGTLGSLTGLSSSGTIAFSGLSTNGPVYTTGGTGTLASEQYLNVARGGSGAGTFTKGVLVAPGTTTAFTTVAGTDNYIPKWSSSYPTTTSTLYDNGNVGVGTTAPSQALDVNGSIALLNNINQTGTSAQLDINPYQQLRLGRSTNNASFVVQIYKGDNTTTINHALTGNGNSYLAGNNGNVGIGLATAPGAKLEVAGTIKITGGTPGVNKFLMSDANGLASWSTIAGGISPDSLDFTEFKDAMTLDASTNVAMAGFNYTFTGTGNVGIGISAPTNKLEVALASTERVLLGSSGIASGLNLTSGSLLSQNSLFEIVSVGSVPLTFFTGGTFNSMTAGTERMRIDSVGNVGIGTTAPNTTLDVVGTIRAKDSASSEIGSYLMPSGGSGNSWRFGLGINLYWNGSNWVTKGDGASNGGAAIINPSANAYSGIAFYTVATTGGTDQTITNANLQGYERMRITPAGNVGIGTTNPLAKFNSQGGASIASSNLANADVLAGTTTLGIGIDANEIKNKGNPLYIGTIDAYGIDFGTNGSSGQVFIQSGGNVGIGTTGPLSLLQLERDSSTTWATSYTGAPSYTPYSHELTIKNGQDATNDSYAGLFLYAGETSGGTGINSARIAAVREAAFSTSLVFATRRSNGNMYENMRIDNAGNVGIGTTAPGSKLSFGTYYVNTAAPTSEEQTSHIRLYENGTVYYGLGVSTSALNIAANQSSGTIRLYTNALERVQIDSVGNVGIGTTAPTQKLELFGGNQLIWNDGGLGSELITNPSFDTDTTGWTANGSVIASVAGGQVNNALQVTNSGAAYGYAYQSFSTIPGTRYKFTYYFKKGTSASGLAYIGTSQGGSQLMSQTGLADANWTLHSHYFTATTATTYIRFGNGQNVDTQTSLFDEVSIKEVTGGNLALSGIITGYGGTSGIKVDGTGNVGIGTTAPGAYKLNVAGNIKSTGSIDADVQFLGQASDTVSAPSFSWTGDTNVGIYRPATDVIGFTTNGSEKMRIDNLGNVGIGTTAPTAKLEIAAGNISITETASRANRSLSINRGTSGLDYALTNYDSTWYTGLPYNGGIATTQYIIGSGVNLSDAKLVVLSNGNVGIGTTNPIGKLSIGTTANNLWTIGTTDAASGAWLRNDGANSVISTNIGNMYYGYSGNSKDLYFMGGGTTPQLAIDGATGNVGIGTTTPKVKLDVLGALKTSRLGTYGTYVSTEVQGIWSISEGYPIDTVNDDFGTQYGMGYAYNTNGGAPFPGEHVIVFTNNGVVNAGISLVGKAYFAGNVGIGTSTPLEKLSVNGTLAVSSYAQIGGTDATTYSRFGADTTGWSLSGADDVLVSGDLEVDSVIHSDGISNNTFLGNVGIGTTVPKSDLGVLGNLSVGATYGTVLAPTSGAIIEGNVGIGYTTPGAGSKFVVNGNVGIGTTSPGSKFHAMYAQTFTGSYLSDGFVFENTGNTYLNIIGGATSEKSITFGEGSTMTHGAIKYDQTAVPNGFQFAVNGNNTAMSIASSGGVGIGTTDPGAYKLNVNGSFAAGTSSYFTLSDSGRVKGNMIFSLDISDSDSGIIRGFASGGLEFLTKPSGWATAMTIVSNGNVGIGTTNPGAFKLNVNGPLHIESATTEKITNIVWTNPSDIRLKDVIGGYDKGLDEILQVNPIQYTYKVDNALGIDDPGVHTGVIAQQVQSVFPEAVTVGTDGYLRYTADTIIWAMVNSIKTLNTKIEGATLTSTGDLAITGSAPETFAVNNLKDNSIVTRISAFADVVTARLRAGFIQTKNLVAENLSVDNLTIQSQPVRDYIASVVNDILNAKLLSPTAIVSPIVETENIIATGTAQLNKIATNEIKPQNQDLIIDLNNDVGIDPRVDPNSGKLAKLIIKGFEGKTVTTIDDAGNASFSGRIIADSLSINNDATISGNLVSNTLMTNEASVSGTLTAQRIDAKNIDELTTNNQSLSTSINDIQKLLADIKNGTTTNTSNQTNLSTIANLEQLTVTGNTNLYNASVSNSLLVGNILVSDNKILSLSTDMDISSLSKVNFFGGAVTIAKDGTMTTKGELIAEAGIRTDKIKGLTDAGAVTVNNLITNNLAISDKYLEATTSAAVIAAGENFAKNGIFAPAIETATTSAGIGILPQNSNEVVIYNDNVKNDSLIYLTPTSSNTSVSQLSVGEKSTATKPYFKVVTDTPSALPIKFNWLIIN